MQSLKRSICFLLCLLICMGALAGCAVTGEGWETTPIVSFTSGSIGGTASNGTSTITGDDQGEPSGSTGSSGAEPTGSGSSSSEPGQIVEPSQLLFTQNKQCVYAICAARGEKWEAAINRLENAFRAYGIEYTFKYYSKYVKYDESAKQILLGEIDAFPESVAANENLRPTDNRISLIKNKLCMVAGSADASLSVVEYFIEHYLEPTFGSSELTNADTYINYADYTKTYALESVTLGGVPIQNYTIVYKAKDSILGIYNTYLTNSKGQNYDYVNKDKKIEVYGGDCLADAELLRDTIAELYGWQLEIAPDTAEETQYEILLPGVNRAAASQLTDVPTLAAMHSYGKYIDGKLIFTSYGTFSMRYTGKGFANYFKTLVNGKTVDIPATFASDISCLDIDYFPRAEGTDVRFVTSNIAAAKYNWGGFSDVDAKYRKEILIAEFGTLDADVWGIQEVCPTWASIINEIADELGFVVVNEKSVGKRGELMENNNYILYRKSMFTEIAKCDSPEPYKMYVDSKGNITDNAGAKIRQVNWVVLQHKATGQTFGFANSHWDWKETAWTDPSTGTVYPKYQAQQSLQYAEIMNRVSQQYNCPMFASADFNCRPYNVEDRTEKTYLEIFIENANMVNSHDAAQANGVLLNDTGSTHSFPNREIEPEYYSSIDHITYTPWDCIEILAYRTIIENAQMDLSDHVPRYIDINFEGTK